MVGGEGIAPTQSNATGFTDPPVYFNGLAAHINNFKSVNCTFSAYFALLCFAFGAKGWIRTNE